MEVRIEVYRGSEAVANSIFEQEALQYCRSICIIVVRLPLFEKVVISLLHTMFFNHSTKCYTMERVLNLISGLPPMSVRS